METSGVDASTKSKKFNKKVMYIIIVCLVTLISLGAYKLYKTKADTSKQKVASCSDQGSESMLKEASFYLYPIRRYKLKSYIEKIEQFKDHDTDPNCLILLTAYYLHQVDEVKASDYFNKLQKNNDSNKLKSTFVTNPSMVEYLKGEVEGLKSRKKQLKENTIYF